MARGYIPTDNAQIEIYVGSTPAISGGLTSNTLCHVGNDAGIISCVATGRYLTFTTPTAGDRLIFAEIYAFDEPELAAPLISATLSSMTVATGFIEKVYGLIDGTIDPCVEFTRHVGSSPTFSFTLP